jgi:hypothetical protein
MINSGDLSHLDLTREPSAKLKSVNHPSESEGEGDLERIVVSKDRQRKLKRDRIVFFLWINIILIVLGTMYSL